MALDRTNPGTFLQAGRYLHVSRGTQEALERGSKADTLRRGTPKQGVSAVDALVKDTELAQQPTHSPQSHKTWGSLSSTLKRPSLVNSIKGKKESRPGIKQNFLQIIFLVLLLNT